MSNVSLVIPSLNRSSLLRGELEWEEARICLHTRSYNIEEYSDTNFELYDTEAEELVGDLLAMIKQVKEINKSLPVNKKEATLQEFETYFRLEHKLALELSYRTEEQVANWEGVAIASFKDHFACTLLKRKGEDYKFSTK